MKILSVSTATSNLSVALNEDSKIIVEKNVTDKRNHSEHLDPLIKEILDGQGLSLKDIDRFAVAIGPGSYTGLRIGITTIKMFSSILNKEVVGVSTLEALSKGCEKDKTLIVACLDARNDNYFAGAYVKDGQKLKNVIADGHYHISVLLEQINQALAENDYQQVVFLGHGIDKQDEKIKEALTVSYSYGQDSQNDLHAGLLGQLAVDEKVVDPDLLLPRYLRRTQAEVDWHKRTGKDFAPDSDYVEEV